MWVIQHPLEEQPAFFTTELPFQLYDLELLILLPLPSEARITGVHHRAHMPTTSVCFPRF